VEGVGLENLDRNTAIACGVGAIATLGLALYFITSNLASKKPKKKIEDQNSIRIIK
jgi:hypothetical protein